MVWNTVDSIEQIDHIVSSSHSKPQAIFKHSTSCSISHMAKLRLEDKIDEDTNTIDFHYLDLIKYRKISNHIEEKLEVYHESPQIILLVHGEVIYDASHFDISHEELSEALNYHFGRSKS